MKPNLNNKIIFLAKQLIQIPSITPNDLDCQKILISRLKQCGFTIKDFSKNGVSNFWASFGKGNPSIVFAGHTDVVPTGPLSEWSTPPFQPKIIDKKLYGRGAADMKSSLAAMIVAVENFLSQYKNFKGSIHFLITSDEEGDAIYGTQWMVQQLQKQKVIFDYAIVGEPTAEKSTGDEIKIGRRGSLSGILKILGKQGHVAYPHLAKNAVHLASRFLDKLLEVDFESLDPRLHGDDQLLVIPAKAGIQQLFPKTTFQVSNIHAGTGVGNVIPGECTIHFNFRFSPAVTAKQLQKTVEALLKKEKIKYEIKWNLSAEPFLSTRGKLLSACKKVIRSVCKKNPKVTTNGGTSDARFIHKICKEIVEFGPCNQTIHQIDEHVSIQDIVNLERCYRELLKFLYQRK